MQHTLWKINEIRHQISMIDGKSSPDKIIINAKYLHSVLKTWVEGNIWISKDRIIYAGKEMPEKTSDAEIVDASGQVIVPGYIEPHVHPFQLYNPQSFADYAAQLGTTTFLSDNLILFLFLENEKAFSILDQLNELPFSFYWWARFDSQTELENEDELFTTKSIYEWLNRPEVLMGGELTAWPRLLAGDDQMLHWLQSGKLKGKKIEGHFPGASEKTLARMRLIGTDGDHEAMTIEEVERRLLHGYAVTLRHSSIRPDLPDLLKGIVDKGLDVFDHLMMTTDGSTPSFHLDGVMDKCIQVALDAGVNPIDAYQMASYNVARYYNMTSLHGFIATGRLATLNFLENEYNPVPVSVLSKGHWLKKDGQQVKKLPTIDWSAFGGLELPYDLHDGDFEFSMPFGIEMVNDVITKPYSVSIYTGVESLSTEHDESYLMLIDRKGKWRVNTMIKGFANSVQGFASSYSNTGDIILIGKNRKDMLFAFNEMKRLKGGIVLVEHGETIAHIPLTIGGSLSSENLDDLILQELNLKKALKERGYIHGDAVYTLLFLQSTHLPYVRITQRGIFDVMKKSVLFPAFMRS
ncbi:adenine deaminase C-terminal domain-containing protein [Paenisporosarcina sp. TG20]|uniref:adenine deaminase C-terminal domain-containing protein n=1 Tax=Paenisporosarcina sp. TG20 TaxID=1211706 RepID=UPI0002E55E80|nr:adenine deaminase C-terminal domain-containing protein [Paenisporosarcina sp. TG20]